MGARNFVSAEVVDDALRDAGIDSVTTDDVVAGYQKAQLQALKAGLMFAAFVALAALLVIRGLPAAKLDRDESDEPASDRQAGG